jgi:predicted nucleotidyltransferase
MPDGVASLIQDLPAEVIRVLEDFVGRAREAFGPDLDAVVLYGSAAEGALRATSDVNVILVLAAFDRAKADRLRDPLLLAHAAVRLSAMFLLRDEVGAATQAFAQKFADVLRRRRVLHGTDPFAGLAIPRAALLARLGQVLLNLTLRLRATYVERGGHEEQLAVVVAEAAAPLRTCAAGILDLEGTPASSPKEALRALAARLGGAGWELVLARLSEARERRLLPPGVAGDTLVRLIELTRRMRAHVFGLAPPPS